MWRADGPTRYRSVCFGRAREKHGLSPLAIHDRLPDQPRGSAGQVRDQVRQRLSRRTGARPIGFGADYLVAHPGSAKGQAAEMSMYGPFAASCEATRGPAATGSDASCSRTRPAREASWEGASKNSPSCGKFAADHIALAIGYCLDTCHCTPPATTSPLRKDLRNGRLLDQILGLDTRPGDSRQRLEGCAGLAARSPCDILERPHWG